MLLKKLFTKPKIEKTKIEALKEIATKFENQIFTESNYEFLYDELEKFNTLANLYVKQNYQIVSFELCHLQISQQKRVLQKDILEREKTINENFCLFLFENMCKVIDFILSKYEIKE